MLLQSVAAAEKAVLEVQAAGDDNDDEWNPGDENSSVSRNKRRRRGGGSPSTKERPPTTPPTERALDRVKDLMVKIQESHVAIISESNKTNLVSWFKNILSASTWTLVLPLVIELAELVDGMDDAAARRPALFVALPWCQDGHMGRILCGAGEDCHPRSVPRAASISE